MNPAILVSVFWLSIMLPQKLGLPNDFGVVGISVASAIVALDFSRQPTRFERLSMSHLAAVAAGALFAPVVSVTTIGTGHLLGLQGPDRATSPHSPGVTTCVVVVVLSPLVEEYVFRRQLLLTLKELLGPAAAVLISAALFGVVHVEALLALGAFASGVVLGGLSLATRGIAHPVLFHSGLNLCGLLGGFARSVPLTEAVILTGSCAFALAVVLCLSRRGRRVS